VLDIEHCLVGAPGLTLDQIKAADPAKPYNARYGATSGAWTTNDFVEAVYKSLTNAKS